MEHIRFYIFFFCLFSLSYICNAQITPVSTDFSYNNTQNAISKKQTTAKYHNNALVFNYSEDIIKNSNLRKNFIITIDESGSYFLSSYVNAVYEVPDSIDKDIKDKKYPIQKIRVYLDDQFLGVLDITKSGWNSAKLQKNKKISLSFGQHVFSFESDMPNVPNVEVIKLSTNYENANFDNAEYERYLGELWTNMDKNQNSKRKIKQSEIDDEINSQLNLKSASNPDSDWQVTSYTLSNPSANYGHKMNVPVVYTYYREIYLSSGANVEFSTAPNIPYSLTSVDPVMYLFSDDNYNDAWSNDDGGGGYQSKLNITIPASGYYYLVVRAYSSSYASSSSGMQGVVNIYKNGSLYQDDAPVSGYMVNVATSNTGILNYFTAYSTGIPKLWLAPNGYTSPIQFHGSTYWYISPMDYNWFDDARFRITKNTSSNMNMYLLVSCEGAWYVYWGNCDVYGSCKQASSTVVNAFPNLKENDAIQTAPQSNEYNCASWAGGRTDLGRYFWASSSPQSDNSSSDWYVAGDFWQSWENYFENDPPRFIGAPDYSFDGANSYNGDIAMWKDASYTHFSVRKEANEQPHGYDWESKPGGHERIMHPRDALEEIGVYGAIDRYLVEELDGVIASSSADFTLGQSVETGLTVLQDIKLDSDEQKTIERLKKSDIVKNDLDYKINNLYEKVNSPEFLKISNPNILFNTEEYRDVYKYCKNEGNQVYPYLIEIIFDDSDPEKSELGSLLFEDVTLKNYSHIMNEVKEEWKENNFNDDGAYIAPSPLMNIRNYAKKILVSETGNNLKSSNLENNETNSYQIFNIFPNPIKEYANIKFNLEKDQIVTLAILDINGNEKKKVIQNKLLHRGEHYYSVDVSNYVNGIYICKLIIDSKQLIRKVLISK